MVKKANEHTAEEFNLDILSGDTDMFKWFLLCFLFGKPIQSSIAVKAWESLIFNDLDTPWAIKQAPERKLVGILKDSGYTRYQYAAAQALHKCMDDLIKKYDGSLYLMLDNSLNDDEFSKRLQELYGVGPKIAEIFSKETEELFAQRNE